MFADKVIYAGDTYYEPFLAEDGRVGYRVSKIDGSQETYIYLNPSTNGGADANVFVYEGVENDPVSDTPVIFVVPEAIL